nr:MAG TPA: hypothetical protein [Bacteriophage sp.]
MHYPVYSISPATQCYHASLFPWFYSELNYCRAIDKHRISAKT